MRRATLKRARTQRLYKSRVPQREEKGDNKEIRYSGYRNQGYRIGRRRAAKEEEDEDEEDEQEEEEAEGRRRRRTRRLKSENHSQGSTKRTKYK